jgi:hypothetical protein
MKLSIRIIAAITALGSLAAVEISAEGRAAGDLANAREIALADAFREAVRQGTGLDVLGSTETRNFTLDFDRVLGSAFGHVKSYKVLESRLGQDGIYRVKISADVEKGAPGAKNKLALRELILRKNSPRLSVRIGGSSGDHATALIEDAARDLQIQTVPPSAPGDFQILGEISLRHNGRQTLNARPPENVFACRGALRAVRTDTGEVVALDTLSELRNIGSPVLEIPDAADDALERALRPDDNDGVTPILGKVIARWVAETDLGATKRIQISNIDSSEFQRLAAALAEQEKISAVWPREFDSQGLSVIDVETRLDNMGLGQEITKATGGRVKLDRSTENLLAFNAGGSKSVPDSATGAAQGDAKPAEPTPWWKVW